MADHVCRSCVVCHKVKENYLQADQQGTCQKKIIEIFLTPLPSFLHSGCWC